MLFMFLLPAKNTRENLFFLYSILSGLALGCCETLFYLISGIDSLGLRMATAVIIHVACGALDGLFVYGIKTKRFNLSPFFFSFMLHGIYNYFAGFGQSSIYFYLSFAVILFAIIECRIQYIKIRDSLWCPKLFQIKILLIKYCWLTIKNVAVRLKKGVFIWH